jgi:hypothetical protein
LGLSQLHPIPGVAGKSAPSTPMKPFDCNRTFPKPSRPRCFLLLLWRPRLRTRFSPNSKIAKRGLPNESRPIWPSAPFSGVRGKWAESTANLERAATLDPKNTTS